MNSRLDELNPMDYENNIGLFSHTYVDYFDNTKRKVRCISDGTDEVLYLIKNSDNFTPHTHICMCDVDDFTYYLKPIVAKQLLEAGKEYIIVKTYLESDINIGMVVIYGQPEYESDYKGFHGFPAFLFEELAPRTFMERKKHRDDWWEHELEDDPE